MPTNTEWVRLRSENQSLEQQLANSKWWQRHWNQESTTAKAELRALREAAQAALDEDIHQPLLRPKLYALKPLLDQSNGS